jgi:hypothetical protein
MDVITKNGRKVKRNLSEEERHEIQAKNMPKRAENGQLLKGQSGNPAGRPKKEHTIVDIFREHEGAQGLIEKLYSVASTLGTDDVDKDALASAKLIIERIVPSLKASEIKVDADGNNNMVYLPSQTDIEDAE